MGELFYKALSDFQKKYPGREEQEKALARMSSDEILQLARSAGTVREACRYARFAQEAELRERNGQEKNKG